MPLPPRSAQWTSLPFSVHRSCCAVDGAHVICERMRKILCLHWLASAQGGVKVVSKAPTSAVRAQPSSSVSTSGVLLKILQARRTSSPCVWPMPRADIKCCFVHAARTQRSVSSAERLCEVGEADTAHGQLPGYCLVCHTGTATPPGHRSGGAAAQILAIGFALPRPPMGSSALLAAQRTL